MSESLKKYLGLSGILLILTLAYTAVSLANSYSASIQPSSYRSFAVTAEGKATSIPDVAEFTYSITTEGGKNITDLSNENTTKGNDIAAFLDKMSIAKADIKTIAYNITPRSQYYNCPVDPSGVVKPCPPSEIVGYTINQTVQVKVRDFTKIGDILSGVTTKGANGVSDLQFTTDDPTKVQDDARTDAINKAIAKAYSIAKAGGFGIGRLLSIDENSYNPTPYYYSGAAMMKDMAVPAAAPTIQPGPQETTINVTLHYEIR